MVHAVAVVLAVVAADVVVMEAARLLVPGLSETARDVLHWLLLACVAAPVVWFLLMRPLHCRALAERERAEAVRREASAFDAQYRAIVETTQEGIWVLGADGRTTYVNRQLADLLGQRPEAMLGRTFFDYMDEDGRALARQLQGRGGLTGRHDLRFRRSDGADVWAVVTANPLPSPTGAAPGVLAMLTEITERKRMEDEDHRLSLALAQSVDCVVLTDADGVILWVNETFERVTGYTRVEAQGKTPRILKSGQQDPEFYTDLWRAIKAGQVFRGMLINRRKNGELYYIDQTITPIRTDAGRITSFVAAGRLLPTGESDFAVRPLA
jgi:PAS domain S-box-containing protein